jgi:hypothetical protein
MAVSGKCVVMIVGLPDGLPTPYDGQYVVAWNPHVRYGTLAITTTPDKTKARVFASLDEAVGEWNTVSKVQPVRPDRRPNKPLSGISITFEAAPNPELLNVQINVRR